ncbi:MAG: integrin alpha [Actinomycetaceae bacterium]|nr:integrin alpha [Actinomycetaceae bacterium]
MRRTTECTDHPDAGKTPGQPRKSRMWAAASALALLATGVMPFAPAYAAEKEATDEDSNLPRWAAVSHQRYNDVIRKTDRIAYPDAGTFPSVACDVTGDRKTDLIFANAQIGRIYVLPYIPYGSDSEELIRSVNDQPQMIEIDAPELKELGTSPLSASKPIICANSFQNGNDTLAFFAGKKVYVLDRATIKRGGEASYYKVYQTQEEVSSISSFAAPNMASSLPQMAIAAGEKVMVVADSAGDDDFGLFGDPVSDLNLPDGAETIWTLPGASGLLLNPLGEDVDEVGYLAVSDPSRGAVFVVRSEENSGDLNEVALRIQANKNDANFGVSVAGVGDLDGDDLPDLAVGAPLANDEAGAFAIVYTRPPAQGPISVQLDSTDDHPVVSESGADSGFLFRKNLKSHLGSDLQFIPGVENADYELQPGALLVGRPIDEEHPAALVISVNALGQNYNSGLGIDSIDSSQVAVLATDEDNSQDGGRFVGVVPPRGEDKLTGILTGDSNGKVDVWTIDLSRQSDESNGDEVVPIAPQPADPSAEPGVTPIDESGRKIWLGKFSDGLGGSLAHGSCDVTGDGKPDIISGNVVRSEWKYDPYYADSTPTKGWILNVTGQVQIIPGGTPGGVVTESDQIISINGPKETQDVAVDANIGFSVACLGDSNGDGIDDFAFGSHTMGKMWVIFGGQDFSQLDLNEELSPAQGWTVQVAEYGSAAFHIARVGDINADGLADVGLVVANANIAIGDFSEEKGAGYLILGQQDASDIDLSKVYESTPGVAGRIEMPAGHTMHGLAAVGDVNGDGNKDFVVTNFQANTGDKLTGKAWVVYGSQASDYSAAQTRAIPAEGDGFALTMPADASYRLGPSDSIAAVGDVNKDGFDDFVIGFDGGQIEHATSGGVALVLGAGSSPDTLVINPDQKGSDRIKVVLGPNGKAGEGRVGSDSDEAGSGSAESHFGYSVDALPSDAGTPAYILVGAYGEHEGDGEAYLFASDIFGEDPVKLADFIANDDERVNVYSSAGIKARFGRSVAFVGDYLGKPTLAIGGDGVIDEALADGSEVQGYAHTAHILATTFEMPGESPAPGGSSDPGQSPAPGGPSDPGQSPGPVTGGDQTSAGVNDSGALAVTGSGSAVLVLPAALMLSAGLMLWYISKRRAV